MGQSTCLSGITHFTGSGTRVPLPELLRGALWSLRWGSLSPPGGLPGLSSEQLSLSRHPLGWAPARALKWIATRDPGEPSCLSSHEHGCSERPRGLPEVTQHIGGMK
jgi:hypothetical protein